MNRLRWSNRNDASDEWWVESVGYEKEQSRKVRKMEARTKLFQVLKHYGYDKAKGFGKQWIRCPFHDDRHASAAVDWGTNYFTCFACDMKGTAIDLVMSKEGLSIDDALRRIELF